MCHTAKTLEEIADLMCITVATLRWLAERDSRLHSLLEGIPVGSKLSGIPIPIAYFESKVKGL
jgi:hypothetical protein